LFFQEILWNFPRKKMYKKSTPGVRLTNMFFLATGDSSTGCSGRAAGESATGSLAKVRPSSDSAELGPI
jgi:hypothetical protein